MPPIFTLVLARRFIESSDAWEIDCAALKRRNTNLLARSFSCLAAVAAACLMLPLTSLKGRDLIESVPADVVELLVSDSAEERIRGERLAAENSSYYVNVLLDRIRTGESIAKGKAAAELGIIISPWLRGKEAGARSYFTSFKAPRRPVDRVSQLAEAGDIRQTLQAAIATLLKSAEVRSPQSHWDTLSIEAMCETLGEVANDETMDWVINRLQQMRPAALVEPFFALGHSYLGIPPIYRSGILCGNSSPAEVDRFLLSQDQAFAEGLRILSAKWTEVRSLKVQGRIAFAIKSWRDHFLPRQQSQSGHYSHDQWLFLEMEPLVRLGTSAVEALRAQQALENQLGVKAVWETVIATITGREDAQMVRVLFYGSSAHREFAIEIVVGATSRDWIHQLEELQFRGGPRASKATRAIATCHREAGIPALKRIFARNGKDSEAGYAIKELEARAASGSPRGMRRHQF